MCPFNQSIDQSSHVSREKRGKGVHENRNREGTIGGKGKRDARVRQKIHPERSVPLEPKRGSAFNHSITRSIVHRTTEGKRREETSNTQNNGTHRPTTEIHSDIAAPSTSYQHGPNHRTLPPRVPKGQGQTSATQTQDNPPAHSCHSTIEDCQGANYNTNHEH